MFHKFSIAVLALILIAALVGSAAGTDTAAASSSPQATATYTVVDTGQDMCFSDTGLIVCPEAGQPFYGQDAQYQGLAMAFQDNGNGTITDLNTGLMWQKTPGDKMTWDQAMAGADSFTLAGYTGWRVPTIDELYSLINFNGVTGQTEAESVPYINTAYFDFEYGDTGAGERMIDAQYWSSTEYVSTTMNGSHTVFGVNFADGRIKGYGTSNPDGRQMLEFVRYVRGGIAYGVNAFADNGDGTIFDYASGLTWTQADSGYGLVWADALAYCETLTTAGFDDWRLPNAKELQDIVDYTRSPDTTGSAAINPLFSATLITDDLGQTNYAFYWTGTTHLDGVRLGDRAVYIAFGEAQGYMQLMGSDSYQLLDVHGAGAQRSDLKSGDPSQFEIGLGPQGDIQVIYNYARCVRGGDYTIVTGGAVDSSGIPAQSQPPQQGNQGQGNQGQGNAPQQGQPPQEAITACNGLNQGDTCTVNTPQGALSGTCQTPQGGQLACVPAP